MSNDDRYDALQSVMQAMHGEARWQAVCDLLMDWPVDEQLQEEIIPSLRALLAHDTTPRCAPYPWWFWSEADEVISYHPALALATGVHWDMYDDEAPRVTAQLAGLRAAGLTCHSLCWESDAAACAAFLAQADLPQLFALSFSCEQLCISPDDAAALAHSPHLRHLQVLDLSDIALDDEDFITLIGSPHLTRLTQLLASCNALTDASAMTLATSPQLSQLVKLDLSLNQLTAAGAQALAKSPQLAHLTSLELSHNAIGDEGAQALASSPYLHETIRAQWRR